MSSCLFLVAAQEATFTEAALSCLTEAERQHANHFKSAVRREAYTRGRVLMRHLLEYVTGSPSEEHIIASDISGRPVSNSVAGINISHSRGLTACIVATRGAVGVDIERRDVVRDSAKLAVEYFSPEEASWVGESSDRFHMLWVLKESWLKATGKGLGGGLDTLHGLVDPPHIRMSVAQGAPYALHLFSSADTYLAVTTTELNCDEIAVLGWDAGRQALCRNTALGLLASGMTS